MVLDDAELQFYKYDGELKDHLDKVSTPCSGLPLEGNDDAQVTVFIYTCVKASFLCQGTWFMIKWQLYIC